MTTHDNDHEAHPDWIVERRPLPEPTPVIPPNIVLGEE